MAWIEILTLDRCHQDRGTFVEYDGCELAVFRLRDPDRVVVMDNACPHAGGNLSAGDIEGEAVTCPWHQWKFDLNTGVCTHSDLARVRRYPAEVRNHGVWVDWPGRK